MGGIEDCESVGGIDVGRNKGFVSFFYPSHRTQYHSGDLVVSRVGDWRDFQTVSAASPTRSDSWFENVSKTDSCPVSVRYLLVVRVRQSPKPPVTSSCTDDPGFLGSRDGWTDPRGFTSVWTPLRSEGPFGTPTSSTHSCRTGCVRSALVHDPCLCDDGCRVGIRVRFGHTNWTRPLRSPRVRTTGPGSEKSPHSTPRRGSLPSKTSVHPAPGVVRLVF